MLNHLLFLFLGDWILEWLGELARQSGYFEDPNPGHSNENEGGSNEWGELREEG